MPYYTYRCAACHKKFDIFLSYTEYGKKPVVCAHCHSAHVQRLINKVRVTRSDESRLESLADPSKLAGLEDDPQSLGRMMRQMSGEVGEEMGPEFDEVVHRLEAGQSPEQIEKDLPELGEGGGTGEDMAGFGAMSGLDDEL